MPFSPLLPLPFQCGCSGGYACDTAFSGAGSGTCTLCTASPTRAPTQKPTAAPSGAPTVKPTAQPSDSPTNRPTGAPSSMPTQRPTKMPTFAPSQAPSKLPTARPTWSPTAVPTKAPTSAPTQVPSGSPTKIPTAVPTSGASLALSFSTPSFFPLTHILSLNSLTQGLRLIRSATLRSSTHVTPRMVSAPSIPTGWCTARAARVSGAATQRVVPAQARHRTPRRRSRLLHLRRFPRHCRRRRLVKFQRRRLRKPPPVLRRSGRRLSPRHCRRCRQARSQQPHHRWRRQKYQRWHHRRRRRRCQQILRRMSQLFSLALSPPLASAARKPRRISATPPKGRAFVPTPSAPPRSVAAAPASCATAPQRAARASQRQPKYQQTPLHKSPPTRRQAPRPQRPLNRQAARRPWHQRRCQRITILLGET